MFECEADLSAGFLFYTFLILFVDPVSLPISYFLQFLPMSGCASEKGRRRPRLRWEEYSVQCVLK